MIDTLLVPSDYGFQSLWKDTYYRIVFQSDDVRSAPPAMWSMNLHTKRWQMEGYLNVTGISVRREMMNSHVVSMHMQENMWLIVSPFYTTLILSKNYIRQTSSPIPFRIQFSVVTINSSSLLLFGGRTVNNVASNDLWQFSLIQRIWKKVKMIESAVSLPSPRYGHTAAVIGVDMFVFGGYNNNGSIIRAYEYKDLWRYNMINHSWSILVPTNNLPFNSVHYYLCFYAATAQVECYGLRLNVIL